MGWECVCVHVCVRRVCVCCGCQVPFHAQIECLSGLVGTSAWARAKRGARGEGGGGKMSGGVSLLSKPPHSSCAFA